MTLRNTDSLVCHKCKNDTRFIELNISGYVANFETKPSFAFTGVYTYVKAGIICADCFENDDYVLIADEGQLLPTHVVEKALKESKPDLKLVP